MLVLVVIASIFLATTAGMQGQLIHQPTWPWMVPQILDIDIDYIAYGSYIIYDIDMYTALLMCSLVPAFS